jgi:hypothetical protein
MLSQERDGRLADTAREYGTDPDFHSGVLRCSANMRQTLVGQWGRRTDQMLLSLGFRSNDLTLPWNDARFGSCSDGDPSQWHPSSDKFRQSEMVHDGA